ncbi:MAG TPA: acyltransferase [Chthoniobacterales bacterium]
MPVAPSPEPPHRKRADRIGFVPQLESLRGVAALMVAAMHACQSRTSADLMLITDPRSWSHPFWSYLLYFYYRILANGPGAVILFFVLSGFVLASSIERGPRNVWPGARHFFIGRIFRIYPAIIFTVLLFSVIFWITGAAIPPGNAQLYRAGNIVRNILLINANIDGVMWTLKVEAVAIPVIFAMTILQQRFHFMVTGTLAVLFVAFYFWRPFKYLVADDRCFYMLFAFVLGIGTHRIGPWLLQRIRREKLGWFVAGTLFLFLVTNVVLGVASKWRPLCECIAGVGMISVLVYGAMTGFSRLLNWKVFRFYGRISYSFYLLHPLTLLVIWKIPGPLSRLLDAGVPAALIAIALTITSVLAITPLAWLSWRFVEIPGIAAGRRVSPERRNASPYVGPHGRVLHQA